MYKAEMQCIKMQQNSYPTDKQIIHCNKVLGVVRVLTLFFQISQSFFDELWGSFELLCQLVSLFTHQTKLRLEVCDAAGQHRQDGSANKGAESSSEVK